jgi:hypothetical protein
MRAIEGMLPSASLTDALFRRLVAAMLVAILLVFRFMQVLTTPGGLPWAYDFSAYWLAGRRLLEGAPIFSAAQLTASYAPQAKYLYLYPPPLAAFVTPLSAVFSTEVYPAFIVWVAAGAAFATLALLAVARVEGLAGRYPLVAHRGAWFLIGAALALPPVIGEITNGNVHFLLLGLFAIGWLGVRRGDRLGDAIAGSAIGVAALIKIFPAFVILWFVLTRRYRAAAWSVVAAAAVALVTLPLTGLQPWLDYPHVLANMGGPIDPTFSIAPTTWLTPLLGFNGARATVAAIGLALVIASSRAADPRIGYAVSVLVALLVTPILWSHYLTIALLPLLLALVVGVRPLIVGLVYLLLSAGNQQAFGGIGFVLARAMPLLGLLVLLAAFLWLARRTALTAPAGTPP